MPYSSVGELPESIRNALPKEAQTIFLGAFNGAWDGTCKERDDQEGCAIAIAWSAVKRAGYHKGEGDQWVKGEKEAKAACPRLTPFFLTEAQPFSHPADIPRAILNTLDRFKTLQRDGKPYTVWFGAENFRNTLDLWHGIPVIYVPKGEDHPDAYGLLDDPDTALKKVNGTVVGQVSEAVIPDSGEPRIEVGLPITDQKVLALWRDGKLSLSTAFLSAEGPMPGMKGGQLRLEGDVEPNHILVFERTPRDQPGDGGAMFLNKAPGKTIATAGDSTDKRWGGLPPGERSTIAEPDAHVGDLIGSVTKEKEEPMADENKKPDEDAEKVALKREIEIQKGMNAEKAALLEEKEKALKAQVEAKASAEWDELAKELPRAMVHGAKLVETREAFYANPTIFTTQLLRQVHSQHAEALKAAGLTTASKAPDKAKELCTGIIFNGTAVTE